MSKLSKETICKICGREFKPGHNWKHRLTSQQYYDQYLKTEQDGLCKVCKMPTIWHKQKFCYGEYCQKHQPEKIHSAYRNRDKAINTCKTKFDGKLNSGAWNTRNARLDQFEQEHNCTRTKKLIQQYGQGWLALKLPKLYCGKQNTFISNEYLPQIIEYSTHKHVNLKGKAESYILEHLQYDGQIQPNNRKVIHPKELDIYIPDLKIAIEFNGTYWHAEERQNNIFIHREKSILCHEKGIRLIHIFEFEDLDEQIDMINQLILGNDLFESNFTKNSLLDIPTDDPIIIYKDVKSTVYSA